METTIIGMCPHATGYYIFMRNYRGYKSKLKLEIDKDSIIMAYSIDEMSLEEYEALPDHIDSTKN